MSSGVPARLSSRGLSSASLIIGLGAAGGAAAQQAPSTPVLEEIIVTATRVETNLQQTPMSVQAFTGEDLELAGIDCGRDLGIMVPNAVMNSARHGALRPTMVVRGLPGVGTYFDGYYGPLQLRLVPRCSWMTSRVSKPRRRPESH